MGKSEISEDEKLLFEIHELEHKIEDEENKLVIEATREHLGLKHKSREWLECRLAEFWLQNQTLQIEVDRFYKKSKIDLNDLLLLGAGVKPKHLGRGIVKTVSIVNPKKGGKGLSKINPQVLLRDEIVSLANEAIKAGLIKPFARNGQTGSKMDWILDKLKEPRYKGKGLSADTLYRDIKFL
jgi:hypothetical protein